MLGLGLDDLVRREAQRRQKRLTYIAAASIAGMTVASGLAVFAFDKRDEARDQRREAEGLVGFMLGDLRDELEPIGKLKALDAVGTRALEYFKKQDRRELSDAALTQRSHALNLLAQIAEARQDPVAALAGYREAMRSTAELVERDPGNPQRLFDHAQNLFYLGEIARDSGDARRAEVAYREYKNLADRMVAIEPDQPKWRMEQLYAKENIGIVLYYQRRYAEATRLLEETVRPMESQLSRNARNPDYQREYSSLLAWLADTYAAQGQTDRAKTVREQQIAFLRPLADRQSDVVFRQHLIPAYLGLANLFLSQGNTKRGIEHLLLSIAESERLLPIEPDNAFWMGLAAQPQFQLAREYLVLDRTADAARPLGVGCDLARRVLARNPGPTWRARRTDCLSLRARLASANGDSAAALDLARQAIASARTERSADPMRDRYRIAGEFRLLGELRERADDLTGAKTAWRTGLAEMPTNVIERPLETRDRAGLLRKLGREAEAARLDRRLASMGVRNTF